ncbi:MAG: TetR family transcriptional regulator [Cyanobacteria bacterium SBLK]|nr:TetR family transcriptional regulator [Cyanobacteria bacterium SBLK]
MQAAAEIFTEVGYETATTHAIAERANTAIGSLYQFFPDKLAIFHALELRHLERVHQMWASQEVESFAELPLEEFFKIVIDSVAQLFENPISRAVFVQYYTSNEMFQTIDDRLTGEAISFIAGHLEPRNPHLDLQKRMRLAEVCVHAGNALILLALRSNDEAYRQQIYEEVCTLFVSYLRPYFGNERSRGKDALSFEVMKVMKCPRCHSQNCSKNGHRHGKQRYLCKDCGRQFPEFYGNSQ